MIKKEDWVGIDDTSKSTVLIPSGSQALLLAEARLRLISYYSVVRFKSIW